MIIIAPYMGAHRLRSQSHADLEAFTDPVVFESCLSSLSQELSYVEHKNEETEKAKPQLRLRRG